jgi:glutathione synthase/RimK-type ligase-like ATP-grasp enzyme
MKIAIHHTPGTFSDRWIAYCEKKGIDYKLVNCYSTDIIKQISDCDALMWHFSHENYKDALFAKQLLYSIELTGKKTFPNYKTCWHFDDKVGQKYLFEAIGARLVPSYVFYSKAEALRWIKSTSYPKVFKLRGGAGSRNVKLVRSVSHAKRLVKKAFGKGISPFDRIGNLNEKIRLYKEGKGNIFGIIKGIGRLFIITEFASLHSNEKGYVYFQDYVPNNNYDIRIIVIHDKAFAIKRMVRKNDFRASGSGNILYERENFSLDTIRLTFDLAEKIQSQCAAVDYVYDSSGMPLITEISYGFVSKVYDPCVGYWDISLKFHEGHFVPQDWMVETLIDLF